MADTMLSGLRTIIGRAVERGVLPADADVELLSVLPLAMLRSWQLTQGHRPDQSLVDRVVKQFYTSERTTTTTTTTVGVAHTVAATARRVDR